MDDQKRPGRIAYCAPGRKPLAALALILQGEHVAEITETPLMEGRTDILVTDPAALSGLALPPLALRDPPRCPLCRGFARHYPWCAPAPAVPAFGWAFLATC